MLTRDFNATVQARVHADPAFRDALLREGIDTMLNGDVATGQIIFNYSVLKRPFGSAASSSLSPTTGDAS